MNHPHPMLGCECDGCRRARVTRTPPTGMAKCDLCGDEFAYWSSGDAEDVFNKLASQIGRVVCPDCIGTVRAQDLPDCMPVLQEAVDGLPLCECPRKEPVKSIPRTLGIWRCAHCGGEVKSTP